MLRKTIAILDTIEVRGKANMSKMLGCMQAIEKIADAIKHNREEAEALKARQKGAENDP